MNREGVVGTREPVSRPSAIIALAPPPISSAGCASIISVPGHRPRLPAMILAVETQADMWSRGRTRA